jgi:hypothetical protein
MDHIPAKDEKPPTPPNLKELLGDAQKLRQLIEVETSSDLRFCILTFKKHVKLLPQ